MTINLSSLGAIIKKYRNFKDYSTKDLADKLNVSAGLINNIENARNDVFKLELLMNVVKELDIPTREILTSILIPHHNNTDTAKNTLTADDFKAITDKYLDLISSHFTLSLSQYEDKEKATELIANHLLEELNSIKEIKNLK
ncbi:helix-turn-helix domain-containing protein [Clostridium sp. ZS2-4]|uniref:helix-turn-helix domain-containing protein n=1 Tax=Clostridium sp. ZS2-4 TaxID=2987703 RepID=UPI00227B048B|nr:helix-turn-helix transcriptional regulator [Clostridium sp. ZS2-4]MCY6354458.1 helix-turn-helix transcriptional regulator [Clostridium sp. ZS2-4]